MNKTKPKFTTRLKQKYRINIIDPENFQELSSFSLSGLQVIMVLCSIAVVSFSSCLLLITYTPVGNYLSANSGEKFSRREAAFMMAKLDSVEYASKLDKQYTENLRSILMGTDTATKVESQNTKPVEIPSDAELFYVSSTDSALRKELEIKKLNLQEGVEINSSIHFYPPVDGYVADSFNAATKHYAVDLVATKDDAVKSIQDGVVIFSDFTSSTGYVMMIQHANNYISAYKHNSVLLKSVGSFVRAGETIGMVGNSGELTTGKHLHFELWQNGQALNPVEYINF